MPWLVLACVLCVAGIVLSAGRALLPAPVYATSIVVRGDIEDTLSAMGSLVAGRAVDRARSGAAPRILIPTGAGHAEAGLQEDPVAEAATRSVPVGVAQADTMTVVAQVAQEDLQKIRLGMNVWFTLPGRDNRRWVGRVRQIAALPEKAGQLALHSVSFEVDNSDRQLSDRMHAQVYFVLARATNAILVPRAALHAKRSERSRGSQGEPVALASTDPRQGSAMPEGKPQVVHVLRQGRIEERVVRIGIADHLHAQVLTGLAPGEEVVIGQSGEPITSLGARRIASL